MTRYAQRRRLHRPVTAGCVVLALVVALIGFFPLGGYQLLPTKYENCFTPDTPCLHVGGEQRNP